MALAKIIERVLEVGKPCGGLLHKCFISLLRASVRLKEMEEEDEKVEDDEHDEEAESDEDNDDDDEDEYDDDDEV